MNDWNKVDALETEGKLKEHANNVLQQIAKLHKLRGEQDKLLRELENVYKIMSLGINPRKFKSWGLCRIHLKANHERSWRRMTAGEDRSWSLSSSSRNRFTLPPLYNFWVCTDGETHYLDEPIIASTLETVSDYYARTKEMKREDE